jgi:hypothetical protein
VGRRTRQTCPAILRECSPLTLHPEPTNPHDMCPVEICTNQSHLEEWAKPGDWHGDPEFNIVLKFRENGLVVDYRAEAAARLIREHL